MEQQKFSFLKRAKSFGYAYNGIRYFIRSEHNAWIHVLAMLVVLFGGFFYNISSFEWIGIVFSIALVFTSEIINTSIENLADFFSPQKNDSIKIVKDLAAGAVLVSAITSLIIGLIIFLPKIIHSI